jgi:hypothetical protein
MPAANGEPLRRQNFLRRDSKSCSIGWRGARDAATLRATIVTGEGIGRARLRTPATRAAGMHTGRPTSADPFPHSATQFAAARAPVVQVAAPSVASLGSIPF